jgi:hypothetical protein
MHLFDPTDVRAATTHPNPYPFYARLAAERPIVRPAPGSSQTPKRCARCSKAPRAPPGR